MAVDISQGIQKRLQEGWFPGKPPYVYENVRIDERGIARTANTGLKKFAESSKCMPMGAIHLSRLIGLNWELNDVSLCATMRKPLDQLAKGLVLQKSGAGGN